MMKEFGFLFLGDKTELFSSICRFSTMTTVFAAVKIDFIAMKTVVIAYKVNLHDNEDGRHGKVLRTSRRKGRKVLSPQTERDTASSANIRFSGSWGLSHFPVFPRQTDKTGPITGQAAHLISFRAKQKAPCRTKCKICMKRNFRWNRKRTKKGLLSFFICILSTSLHISRQKSEEITKSPMWLTYRAVIFIQTGLPYIDLLFNNSSKKASR